ncbi:MAG: PilT/PilU family type 4a pilus ATPase [Oscillospiraceae bacterium]|nr:PilT/PilU family type 4a pilus ATPase [Oscillospiraceae bacterium]
MPALEEILNKAAEIDAADIFILPGTMVSCKANGLMHPLSEERLMPDTAEDLISEIYKVSGRSMDRLKQAGDDDFSFALPGLSRFRVNTYKQRGSLAAVIRIIKFGIPSYKDIGVPDVVMSVTSKTKGLILVTGPAGSGKSTTLACIIDQINETREGHIITLEEPIEFLHKNKKSIVSQREVELDTINYVTALRACLRQSPDVILVGEMRDYETIQTAMTAAETGHLVISTLHTVGAANTIDRIVDVFPPAQQQQIRIQISMLLQAVVSQQLIPTVDGHLTPCFEVMFLTNAIRNVIRESKIHQIDSIISTSAAAGMISMDASLAILLHEGKITMDTAQRYAVNPDMLQKRV